MRWIDIKGLADEIEQLSGLLEHCREMAAAPDSADDWGRDVRALEHIIKSLESEVNDERYNGSGQICRINSL